MCRRALFLFLVTSLATEAAHATCPSHCKGEPKKIDLSVSRSIGELRAPVNIKLVNVNRLRYAVTLTSSTELKDGPTLNLAGFIPPLPSLPKLPTEDAADMAEESRSLEPETGMVGLMAFEVQAADSPKSPTKAVAAEVRDIKARLSKIESDLGTLQSQAKEASDKLVARSASLDRLVRESDARLAGESGAKALVAGIGTELTSLTTDLADANWPTEAQVQGVLDSLGAERKRLLSLPRKFDGYREWWQFTENALLEKALFGAIDDLEGSAKALLPNSDAFVAFKKLKDRLGEWKSLLSQLLDENRFELTVAVDCGFPYLKEKNTAIQMTSTDRLEVDPEKAKRVEVIATVVCPSHFAISAGMGLSTNDERNIGFIQSVEVGDEDGDMKANQVVSRFGFTEKGGSSIDPLALMHARLTNWQDWNLHATAGGVLKLDGKGGSTTIGYVLGGSISIRDHFFLTSGLEFSRASKLTGGFDIGEIVPKGISSAPLERRWVSTWMFAATYKR